MMPGPNIGNLPASIARLLDAAAAKHGLPREIARAVAWVESRGNAAAVSPKGAIGVMQLMPATAEALGVTNPRDAAANIDAGVRYLAQLVKKFGEPDGLAAYNWGPGRVSRAAKSGERIPGQVQTYVTRVQARAQDERLLIEREQQPEGSRTAVTPLPPRPKPQSGLRPPRSPRRPGHGDDET